MIIIHFPYWCTEESAPSKRVKIDSETSAENPESAAVTISEPLAMFLGTGKKEMLQSEATQYILEYIKVNQWEVGGDMTCSKLMAN